jgi:hypothetical protein
MGVLGSVIAPSTALMAIRNSQILGCGPIGPQVIRYELIWHKSVLLQKLAQRFSAARLFLLLWTRTSRTSPSASTARHR